MKVSLPLLLMLCACRTPPAAPPPPVEAPPPRAVAKRSEPSRAVAVTLDDLPLGDIGRYTDDAERHRTVEKLAGLIKERRLPVTGFFIMSHHARHPSLLPVWRDAGVRLGNHTWSHPSPNRVSIETYLADLERGHRAVAALAPPGGRVPFRHPYLDEGFLPEKRAAIQEKVRELGSVEVPVTIDTSDWLYARGYLDARHQGDRRRAELYRRSWRWNIEESTLIAELLARELFGREPPQILLLHANALNADHLGQALDWLAGRGYRFVSLEEALADPAYREPDRSTSPTGDSRWLRLLRSRKLRRRGPLHKAEQPR
jgi:peptidoglycan/xylan/chitin deacetylase (PgdA/CDA1 family)